MTIRELVKNDIDALPDESLQAIREFVLFQKYKDSLIPDLMSKEDAENEINEQQDLARKRKVFQSLMKYHKSLPADFDCDREISHKVAETSESF